MESIEGIDGTGDNNGADGAAEAGRDNTLITRPRKSRHRKGRKTHAKDYLLHL
jgi:hypothetical protein